MTLKHLHSFGARAKSWRETTATQNRATPDNSMSKQLFASRLFYCSIVCLLLLAGCGGGDNDTVTNNPGTSADSGGVTTTSEDFGANGLPAFRLRANNNGFNLIEGESISVPVSIDRVNGHQETINLTLSQPGAPDELLAMSLDRLTLQDGETQALLNATFRHGRQRALEQQRSIAISANDGLSSAQITVLLNIRPTTLPDVYLLAGQSNMVGFSEFQAKDISPGGLDEPNPQIQQLNVTANDYVTFDSVTQFGNPQAQTGFPQFVVAEDPLHTSKDPSLSAKVGSMVGMGLTFAKRALINDGSHRIILVPAAWSSTGFCDTGDYLSGFGEAPDYVGEGELGWNPFSQTDSVFGGTTLFNRAVLRANLAIQNSGGILRGILWHQGESDGGNADCAAAYAENFATLASELRTRIIPDARGAEARGVDSDVPFIAGTMSRGTDFRGDFSEFSESKQLVDNVHRNIGAQGVIPHYGVAILDDITPDNNFPCGEGSCVHFGSDAYREIGNRYYQTLESVLSQP